MKIVVFSFLFNLFLFSGYSQSVYDLSGNSRSIKKGKLETANLLNDLIPNYPSNWITSHNSVEIITVNNGVEMKANGENNVLTPEQKFNLKSADVLTSVIIKVKYTHKNTLNNKIESHSIDVAMYVAPDVNAKFENDLSLRDFVKKSVLGNLRDTIPGRLGMVTVKFTINEDGEVINSKIFKSSGDLFTDMRLLHAISTMPKWKPAENERTKIRQDFLFSFGGC